MPDYNKGDFTQQGIDGFVEGGLHLNEKRCLTAKISTDEEAEGLDSVEINIHDHLNDLDYTITGENLTVGENTIGGGGGHLATVEFEENGTYYPADYEAYGFGEVTVNVSGGGGNDIRICTAKIINNNTDEPVYEVAEALGGYTLIDNVLYEGVLEIEQSTTSTRDYVVRVNSEDFTPALYFVCFYHDTAPVTISEMVNCKISENHYMGKIVEVIDPSEDCSFTATISNAA